jgi:ribonucleoside-diphosphate reductase alpha chain
MTAVVCNDWWELKYTRAETGEVISKKVKARDLMMKLAYNNWEMGEPGVLFWDSICGDNLLSGFDDFEYAGVNPCAEEPLPAGGSCLLGSMNLSEYVVENGVFDFESFADDVFQVTVAMNKVLDEGLELHPLQEQRDSVRDWRQIGIGVMGIADMLIKMGITYGSEEAAELCEHIAEYMFNFSLTASCSLAVAKGKSFPKFDYNKLRDSHFYRDNVWDRVDDAIRKGGLYNSQLLTIAPTGTLSTMLGISGGIEPIFANSYERKTESLHGSDVYYKVYTPIVEKYMKEHGLTDESELPEFFVTARDITPKDRIRMQEAWQYYIDASISSTINLPESATPEDVLQIYIDAWHAGLKGITVFREGCKRAAILSTGSHKEEVVEASELPRGHVVETSDKLVGKKRKLITGCGSLHVTAFFDPKTGDLMETYLSKGSTGGCANSLTGLSRMISLAARAGVGIQNIVDQLDSSGACPSYAVRRATKGDTSKGSCCPMAVGNALIDMWKEVQNETHTFSEEKCEEHHTSSKEKCPQCGEPIVNEGGCVSCKACGWSKCDL